MVVAVGMTGSDSRGISVYTSVKRDSRSVDSAILDYAKMPLGPAVTGMALAAVTLLREYATPIGEAPFAGYSAVPGAAGLRWVDMLVVLAWTSAIVFGSRSRFRSWRVPRRIGGALLTLFLAAVLLALANGVTQGAEDLFFDLRPIIVFLMLAGTLRRIASTRASLGSLIAAYSAALSLAALVHLVLYLLGGGVSLSLLGGRVPVFDGPTLSAYSFAAIAAFGFGAESGRLRFWALSVPPALVVLASLRRSFWAELIIGLIILFVVLWKSGTYRRRRLLQSAIVMAAALLVVATTIIDPARLEGRIRSLNPYFSASEYAATNADHVGDVVDAWEAVQKNPVIGLGAGVAYDTERIRHWKTRSLGVHNGLLHAWVVYGVPGLLSFLLAFMALFHPDIRPRQRAIPVGGAGIRSAMWAWLVAAYLVSFGFAPWVFGGVQRSVALAIAVTVLFTTDPGSPRRSPIAVA